MITAFLLGVIAQSSLLLSGLAAYVIKAPRHIVGGLAAFGAGALIAAVSLDLVPEAKHMHVSQVAFWMLVGAAIFILGDHYVEKKFGADGSSGALGVIVGSIVDGIPESIIFGVQIASGTELSVAFIVAVFVSNIPQAFAPSADLAQGGKSWRRVGLLWSGVVLACGAASALGYLAANEIAQVDGLRMSAIAAGGIIAMLSDSLIPFAHERTQRAGTWTVVGFCAALAMT